MTMLNIPWEKKIKCFLLTYLWSKLCSSLLGTCSSDHIILGSNLAFICLEFTRPVQQHQNSTQALVQIWNHPNVLTALPITGTAGTFELQPKHTLCYQTGTGTVPQGPGNAGPGFESLSKTLIIKPHTSAPSSSWACDFVSVFSRCIW